MARDPEKNALVREERVRQILDAALSVYVRRGYHGADMDAVAEEARLAKGLLYYYYKTKQELFRALFARMFEDGYALSSTLLEKTEGMEPIERLMTYVHGMFMSNNADPRMMQFFLRAPFDTYAIFNPAQWTEGAMQSDMHRRALTDIISQGIASDVIPNANADSAANSFWSVFVANAFVYSKLMMGAQTRKENDMEALRETVRFGFQGLGVRHEVWNACLENLVTQNKTGGSAREGL